MNDKPAQATATEIAMQHAPTRGEATAQQLRRIHGLNDHDRELVQHAADMLEIASRAPRAEVGALYNAMLSLPYHRPDGRGSGA